MSYELFFGWRYLYFRRRSAALRVAFLLGSALCGGGIALFFLSPLILDQPEAVGSLGQLRALAAISIGVGGLTMTAAGLLSFFSTFTAISMLGVAIGVSILIWVLSVTSGFQEEFRRKVLGVNAHILILKYGLEFSEYRDVMRSAEAVKGVTAAAPFVFNEMMIARGQRLSGVLVKGVDPRLVGRVLDLPQHVEKPRRVTGRDLSGLITPSVDRDGRPLGPPGLVLGRDLAETLEVEVGDVVRLISPLSGLDLAGWAPSGEIPRSRDFRVAAIFFSGFNEYDRRLVYVHMREVQSFLDQGDVVTGVDLKLAEVFKARSVARGVLAALGGPPYRTIDWSELNHNLFTALAIQKLFLRVFIGLIVVVAAFNVLAALAVLVIRKTREIAILKSLGTSRAGVARVFMSTGVIVWIFGAGLGLLWGYLGGLLLSRYRFPLDPKVYHISELPVRMDPSEFVLTAGFALVLCLLAVLYPAIRAGLLHPVEGLRYE